MPTLHGIKASVRHNSIPLPEYAVKVTAYNTVECHIESTAGNEFDVIFERDGYEDLAMDGKLEIDGQRTRGITVRIERRNGVFKGFRTGVDTEQPFRFAALTTTDDENVTITEQTLKALGQMTLSVWRSEVVRSKPWTPFQGSVGVGPIYEQSKKSASVSHLAELGEARTIKPTNLICTRTIDPLPYAIFIFKYRSRALLEADGIVEPAPAATSTEADESALDLTLDESPIPVVSTSGKRAAPDDAVVKSEEGDAATASAAKKAKTEPGESIDLDDLPATAVDVKPYAPVQFKVEQDGTIDLT